jgi:nucleotide-binding universal stress UspA family protein
MDRILVATDFSTRSDRALRRASLIASRVGAKLTLVHAIDADWPQTLIEADRAAASTVMADIAAKLGDEGHDVDWIVKVDDVHAGILAAADEIAADLIVIGPHRSRLRDIFVGTTAERVTGLSTRPLLVAVGTPADHHRKTLLALDFDAASEAAGRKALEMGIFERTEVVVMHAFDAPAEGMLKRSLHPSGDVARYVATEGDAAHEKLRTLIAHLGLPDCRIDEGIARALNPRSGDGDGQRPGCAGHQSAQGLRSGADRKRDRGRHSRRASRHPYHSG